MEEGTDWALELVVVVLILAMMSPFFFKVSTYMLTPTFGGFGSTIAEKTALNTTEEIFPTKRIIDRNDVMLMLAVADKYAMDPIQYDINGFIFNVDDTYFSNRVTILATAFANMDASAKEIVLYYGPGGPRKWVIQNE